MANKKITELPFIHTISGSNVFDNPTLNTVVPVVMYGTTNQITVENYAKFINLYNAHTGSAGNTFAGPQTINNNVTISGNTSIGGTLTVAGKITAQEFFTEITSASIIFESGSTIFGNSGDDTHTFTGSIILNGSTIGAGELNAQTASQDLVNLQISSTTGSINQTTSSFDSVFLGISSVTGSFRAEIGGIEEYTASLKGQAIVSSSTQITNYHKFAETASANTFYGNQNITGSLSVSAGEFNVTTGSLALTSSLRFDHTQNDGATLQLSHDNNTALADHAFNVTVKSAGVYTSFVQNGTPYSILNVEAFDNNNIYLYRDTRLYNKSLFIDNNLTVQENVVIGTGSLNINNGQFSITSGSGELTSSLSFRHTTIDPITGNATLELRYRNNDVGPENNAWKFMASDSGVALVFEQDGVDRTLLSSNDAGDALIFRDTRLFGKGLTVDNSLLVKGVITGSILATNGVVSSSNQLFELNAFTASVIGQTNTIAAFTSSVNFATQSLNTQTGSQNSLNTSLGLITSSIYGEITSFNSVFQRVSSTTGSINAQSSSQDLVNLGISSVTGSLIGITNGLMAFTAALDSTYATDAQLYQLYQATASIHSATASLNTQTGSQSNLNAQIGIATSSLNSVSASLIGITNGLMAFTAALDSTYATDAQLYQLYQATASIHSTTASLNVQTGSQNSVNFNISVVTSSIDAHILKQAIQTGSQDLVNLGISTYTGSQNVINSSIDSHILKQATQTGSQDLVNLGISTFTGSLRSEVNLIEAYTASLKGAIEVSGQNVNVLGMITAQQFNVTFVSSSVMYQSGSTKFGNSNDDKHEFTGSIALTGTQTIASTAGSGLRIYGAAGTHQWDTYLNGENLRISDNTAGDGALVVDTRASFGSHVTASGNLQIGGSTKFGDTSSDIHEFTGSKFEILNSDTSGTMYAVVKNNRSRNAAVKTTTTNGSFIAGTSIGTDAFQYQIYDEVEGTNRVTINSQGGTTLQGAVTASQGMTVSGTNYAFKSGGGGAAHQTLVGQCTAAATTVAKKIAFVGYTHAIRVNIWATQDASNGVTAIADFTTMYGSSNGGVVYSAPYGNVTNIAVAYNNGGSPAYTIDVTLTYTGTAPTINYSIVGISQEGMYTIA